MAKRRWTPILAVLALCAPLIAGALEQRTRIGHDENGWSDLAVAEGVELVSGRWASRDIVLTDRLLPGGDVDLLATFNGEIATVDDGHYVVSGPQPPTVAARAVRGRAAAFRGEDSLSLSPTGLALFSPGSVPDDFTIEFWLYPALLTDGEVVLSVEGARIRTDGAQRFLDPQLLEVVVDDRRLVWRFVNLFTPPAERRHVVQLSGLSSLLPRQWHHHMLRYDASYGLLEYLVDGVPEAVVHATDDGREGGTVFAARIGDASTGTLTVGDRYTGLIDELLISRRYVEEATLSRYTVSSGSVVTRVFDLGASGTRISSIDLTASRPGATDVYLFYRVSDLPLAGAGVPWTQAEPGQTLDTVRGRYLQIRVVLLADGPRNQSPVLSDLSFVYEERLPPSPPLAVTAIAANGAVELSWNRVPDRSVRGYLVYYGTLPGRYRGLDSTVGVSPIDAGDTNRVIVDGLVNGTVYYFAITSYDAGSPRRQSAFSREVAARPSAILPDPRRSLVGAR